MKISSDYYCLKTVAPVSIGCDEVYEPISFVIDEDKKELVNFSVYSFLEQLDSDTINKFSDICQKGTIESLLEIMRFIY
ncbi:MAG: hypothetical protein GWP10_22345, partial [Nitrospiraceae bacterium]|nr:hypothetical protein [Nitrospiraceae bacterium]